MQMGCAECTVPGVCCVAGQRVAVSLGTGSDASQPADDSCALVQQGHPRNQSQNKWGQCSGGPECPVQAS